jgi:hypothetical protein
MPMTKVESALCAAGAWTAAAALAPAGAAAAAGTAIDIPAQVFAHGQTSSKPAIEWKRGPDFSTRERNWAVGRSFRVNVPLGAGGRLPLRVHIYSSEEVCHDDTNITAAAANREQDFVRGGDH